MMFSYNIAKTADAKAFAKACGLIEKNVSIVKKEDTITDVDGSKIQIYSTDNGNIKVFNDYEVDAVYCDSDISLDKILN